MKPEYAKVYAFDPEMITNLPFVHYKTKNVRIWYQNAYIFAHCMEQDLISIVASIIYELREYHFSRYGHAGAHLDHISLPNNFMLIPRIS